jgi:phage terminase large subunit
MAEEEPPTSTFSVNYNARPQFRAFHARKERFACIVAHRRAGKTVACVHDLQRGAVMSKKERPRFAYLSPFLRQSKQVAWDYLRAAMAPSRAYGASVHETELRVDYPNGGQVRLFGADNPDALRGIYLDGVVLDEYADMDPRVWGRRSSVRRSPIGRAGRCSSAPPRAATPSSSCGGAPRASPAGSP